MAFVTCSQFKTSQEAQDNAAIKVEVELLDCAENAKGVTQPKGCEDSAQGGVITVEKIKDAIAGDVEVAVKSNSGITGNGTKESPLALNIGDGLTVSKDGKLTLEPIKAGKALGSTEGGQSLLQALKDNSLLGDDLDVVDGKLIVKTTRFVDASGEVILGYGVDKE